MTLEYAKADCVKRNKGDEVVVWFPWFGDWDDSSNFPGVRNDDRLIGKVPSNQNGSQDRYMTVK